MNLTAGGYGYEGVCEAVDSNAADTDPALEVAYLGDFTCCDTEPVVIGLPLIPRP